MPEMESVLAIKDKDGNLIAVVFNNLKKKSQIFYKTKECGTEDIKTLLEDLLAKKNES
jgi:hypothetical protein